ncbi:restriction endonuclease subunit S [Flagellimonas sp.]|uniref:restriction endonuclease subunit S n=1 Tax=Flagellimonas sp. TaxID=2058762 RepID=UPI003BA857E5
MRLNYKKLGQFIERCDEKNVGNVIKELRGISNQKYFQKAKTNTIGVDLSKYRIVRRGQFAFNRATTRNGDKISIALRQGEDCIVSPSYRIFRSKDENVLNSEYLMMWFRRPEFDRYARFKSHGSAHEFFDYDEMCDVELPIPSIEKQRDIVKEYNTVVNRIKLNEQLNQKLEETAQALYKHWFVDFNFPAHLSGTLSGVEGYKSSGGAMVYNEELDKEIPEGWRIGHMKDIVKYTAERISVADLTTANYITTTNMMPNRGGVLTAESLPSVLTVTEFEENDILISNIRPYFKKIWLANYKGGCSNDVLCFKTKIDVEPLFAYYILESDDFFDYVMQGAKGTKMPRGDKKWIMKYPIIMPSLTVMKEFTQQVNNLQKFSFNTKAENDFLLELSSLLLSKMTRVEEEIYN